MTANIRQSPKIGTKHEHGDNGPQLSLGDIYGDRIVAGLLIVLAVFVCVMYFIL